MDSPGMNGDKLDFVDGYGFDNAAGAGGHLFVCPAFPFRSKAIFFALSSASFRSS
jgi:hypothetical protein